MKKRILIVTKFYYRRGGDCVCALNTERLLTEHGHEVAIFAMDYHENIDSPWRPYWPSAIDFSGGTSAKIAAMKRTFGLGDVAKAFSRLLDDFRPDVVHLHNIHSYLSPCVARIARKRGVRVVWTLHDYKLICPSYSCLRGGKVCEDCFTHKLPVLSKRCMKGSLVASALAYAEARYWSVRKLQRYTDSFICPSAFMKEKMTQGGYDSRKLTKLANFIAPELLAAYEAMAPQAATESDGYCYIGRLSEEKGVRTLLEVASRLPYRLDIGGDGPLAEELRSRYASCANIRFLGRLSGEEVRTLFGKSRLSVMPSECYDNNPISVIESLCAGIPVVGANIGGIPELITQGRGLCFESGNADALARAITQAWDSEWNRHEIKRGALEEFSPERHYRGLMDAYGDA